MFNAHKNKKGFTLIELLVVVAIIALVTSMVIVSLSQTRKRANSTAASQAVKELQKAIELYAINNNGVYPQEVLNSWVIPPAQCDTINGCNAKFNELMDILKTNKYLLQTPNFYLAQLSEEPYLGAIQYNIYRGGQGNTRDTCGDIVAKNYYIYISSQVPLNLPHWKEYDVNTPSNITGDPSDYCVGN